MNRNMSKWPWIVVYFAGGVSAAIAGFVVAYIFLGITPAIWLAKLKSTSQTLSDNDLTRRLDPNEFQSFLARITSGDARYVAVRVRPNSLVESDFPYDGDELILGADGDTSLTTYYSVFFDPLANLEIQFELIVPSFGIVEKVPEANQKLRYNAARQLFGSGANFYVYEKNRNSPALYRQGNYFGVHEDGYFWALGSGSGEGNYESLQRLIRAEPGSYSVRFTMCGEPSVWDLRIQRQGEAEVYEFEGIGFRTQVSYVNEMGFHGPPEGQFRIKNLVVNSLPSGVTCAVRSDTN